MYREQAALEVQHSGCLLPFPAPGTGPELGLMAAAAAAAQLASAPVSEALPLLS